jgi:hypothetical protein
VLQNPKGSLSSNLILDAVTKQRVIERLAWSLRTFHDAEKRMQGGFESVSWRGQLGGFRHALDIIAGRRATSEILQSVRCQTGLGFPHVGPVTDSGEIFGMDSEAAVGL